MLNHVLMEDPSHIDGRSAATAARRESNYSGASEVARRRLYRQPTPLRPVQHALIRITINPDRAFVFGTSIYISSDNENGRFGPAAVGMLGFIAI